MHPNLLLIQMLILKNCGTGVVDYFLNKLSFESHLTGYQYCGPGTKLEKKLTQGGTDINELNKSCRCHDTAYSKCSNLHDRHNADYELEQRSWERLVK